MSFAELTEHRSYWNDETKVARYRAALSRVVTPGSIVLDLGCGTGLLGLLALEAGAKHVYAVDAGSIISLAREIAERNGAGDRITHIQCYSTSLDLPVLADVVVADQIGGLGYEAGVLQYYSDAEKRLLKPGGVFVPNFFRLLLAPIQSASLDDEVEYWRTPRFGLDVSPAHACATNVVHSPQLLADNLLATPQVIHEQPSWQFEPFAGSATFVIERPGVLQGIGGMFDALMAEGVCMSNNPLSPDHMEHRWNSVYPLSESVAVVAGDTAQCRLQVDPVNDVVSWSVEVQHSDGRSTSCRQSTFLGAFLSPDDLRRQSPDYVPHDSGRGDVWRTALELVAQKAPVSRIETALLEQYPSRLLSRHEASKFVARLVAAVEG